MTAWEMEEYGLHDLESAQRPGPDEAKYCLGGPFPGYLASPPNSF